MLFPALHTVLSAKQIKDLGEQFEKEEDKLFGEEGFEKTVDQVAAIEKQPGIYDLAQSPRNDLWWLGWCWTFSCNSGSVRSR